MNNGQLGLLFHLGLGQVKPSFCHCQSMELVLIASHRQEYFNDCSRLSVLTKLLIRLLCIRRPEKKEGSWKVSFERVFQRSMQKL